MKVELQARLAETEQQLRDALSEYDSLKRDYDQAMAQLQEEIAALDKMQAELEKKRKTQSAMSAYVKQGLNPNTPSPSAGLFSPRSRACDLYALGNGSLTVTKVRQGERDSKTADKSAQQAELKSIINDLNKHLEAMKTQVAQQQEAIGQLQQEKEGLEQRLQESHDQATQGNQQLQGLMFQWLNEDVTPTVNFYLFLIICGFNKLPNCFWASPLYVNIVKPYFFALNFTSFGKI
ncbi:predicted protein [Nematostella vectensis]|uniref:Uncharacterized protein n=1 Tax=Nematostella vectensis TaxID=45351 RepID=A7SR18_NEMVE|nr:predicted protein [Nematostella vectensis]|eukprot:XP_001625940.1 predicted protein [Nematostella vectensis]